jgi:hypothetical protein
MACRLRGGQAEFSNEKSGSCMFMSWALLCRMTCMMLQIPKTNFVSRKALPAARPVLQLVSCGSTETSCQVRVNVQNAVLPRESGVGCQVRWQHAGFLAWRSKQFPVSLPTCFHLSMELCDTCNVSPAHCSSIRSLQRKITAGCMPTYIWHAEAGVRHPQKENDPACSL